GLRATTVRSRSVCSEYTRRLFESDKIYSYMLNSYSMTKKNISLAALLIVLGIAGRMALLAYPNIETLMVVSILAGTVLGWRWGVVVSLFSVIGSDMIIGNTAILLYTWSAWLIIGSASALGRRDQAKTQVWSNTLRNTGLGVFGTLFFYAWTNFGVWHIGGLYPHTLAGLLLSYINALPFLHNQLLGNLFIVPAVSVSVLTVWKYLPQLATANNRLAVRPNLWK
ncbi:MAG: hypothetical protein ACD_43C00269G0009, partial [uncultured bacterium]